MSRPAKSESERLRLAIEARCEVDKELASMPVRSHMRARYLVAGRFGISMRTLRSRLADAASLSISKGSADVLAVLNAARLSSGDPDNFSDALCRRILRHLVKRQMVAMGNLLDAASRSGG